MTTQKQKEQLEAINSLKEIIKPGMTVFTVLKHVSRSGMMRHVAPYVIINNEPHWIGYRVAKALDWPLADDDGVKIGGCGMDVGFELVYNLSRVLFRDNFVCIGENCHSNDHVNGDRDRTPHLHSDAGYALRQRWI